MTPTRKLLLGALVVVGVTAYMAYVGAAASWKYYLTIDECAANARQFVGQRMRVSGTVAPQSLYIAGDRRQAQFVLQGTASTLAVTCAGLLPDNLAEAMDVVVEGRLESPGLLRGEKVLTRCASKYEPQVGTAVPAGIPAAERKGGP